MRRLALWIIGALLILFSAFLVARSLVEDVEAELRAVGALRSILEQIKNMVECYSLPIGQILKGVDGAIFEACGYKSAQGVALPPEGLMELIEGSEINDRESRDIFIAFAKDFGKSYRRDESLRCAAFLEKMRSREQKLYKESAKKKKVIYTVAICGALAFIVLLI